MLPVVMLNSSLLPRTMVLACCPCFEWWEGLKFPSVNDKDLIQCFSKQRGKKSPAFFLSMWLSCHSWDLCTLPSSRWYLAYLALFSHTAYRSTQTPRIFCRLLSLSLSLFHSFTLLSFVEWVTISKQKNMNMSYLANWISCIRTAFLLFLQFVGISCEISVKGKKSCNGKGKHS